jgi:hypothetical protein
LCPYSTISFDAFDLIFSLNQIGKVYATDDAVKLRHEGGEMIALNIPIQSSFFLGRSV